MITSRRCAFTVLTLCLISLSATGQETGYIVDQLLAGVHRERTLDSPIIKVLPSGTKLEVLSQDDDFAQIRTADGITGWIDTSYLTPEKPARLLLGELQAERDVLTKALDTVRSELMAARTQSNAEPSEGAASVSRETYERLIEERDTLVKEVRNYADQVETLKVNINAQGEDAPVAPALDEQQTKTIDALSAKIETLEAKLAEAAQPVMGGNDLRQLAQLAEENKRLRETLSIAESAVPPELTQNSVVEPSTTRSVMAAKLSGMSPIETLRRLDVWQIALLGFSFLLAFSAGGYWIDFLMRRRHGGFRL